jgi:hypothetical protein
MDSEGRERQQQPDSQPHMAVINMTTMNMNITTHLPYYSGYFALDCPPTEGSWDGDVFTSAADGSKWTFDPSDAYQHQHPAVDGTGYSYLIPLS